VSDDGRHALTVIAFVGSVFSPYYAAARRQGAADPAGHCAINAVLYGPRSKRWALTERGAAALQRSREHLQIGPSAMHWDGACLAVDIDEITVPIPGRLRGRVRLYPGALTRHQYALDAGGRHLWWPAAPVARVAVSMQHPALDWQGHAYFDSNGGSEPLENGFRDWDWSRAALGDGGCAILYDTRALDGLECRLALRFDGQGRAEPFAPPSREALPATPIWRIGRGTGAERGMARVRRTLEDTPFYARSLLATTLLGEPVTAVHESLSMVRFRQRWVQYLLPFRMPRRARY
jgi:carotenoid 1,2-hydratase